MNIVYDHQIFYAQRYGGISRYFVNLNDEISKLPNISTQIVAPLHRNYYLSGASGNSRGLNLALSGNFRGRTRIRNLLLKMNYALHSKPDIIHETYYSSYGMGFGRARILTVYDMIHELFAEFFSPRDETTKLKKLAVKRADHIICISHATRSDLIRLFDVDPRKTSVVHLAPSMSWGHAWRATGSEVDDSSKYLLYVGQRGGYKNFDRLCEAYAQSKELRDHVKIVAFGGGRFTSKEKGFFEDLGIVEALLHVDGGDEVLAAYYSKAIALVYPSLYEGFGLPPLEAMNLNCPVVCSQTSSIPEVVGDAGLYIDPYSVSDIRNALEKVVGSQDLRQKLVAKGEEQRRRFSWSDCATQTKMVYEEVLGRDR